MIAALIALAAGLTTAEPAVYFRDTTTIRQLADHPWGAPARVVRRGRSGQPVALRLDLPASGTPVSADLFFAGRDGELYVLSGAITIGRTHLEEGDYAFIPAGSPIPARIGSSGASLFWAEDDSAPASAAIMRQAMAAWRAAAGSDPLGSWTIKHGKDLPWVPGTVAQAAGVSLDLKVKHLREDARTGSRTFLIWMGPGTKMPWEKHAGIKEGILVSGRFALEECLPSGRKRGIYRPGGYFHRPGGVVHSGPRSGTNDPAGAIWLIRTPVKLVTEFVKGCQAR